MGTIQLVFETLARVTPLTSTTVVVKHAAKAIIGEGVAQRQSSTTDSEGAAQRQNSSFKVVTRKSVYDLDYS